MVQFITNMINWLFGMTIVVFSIWFVISRIQNKPLFAFFQKMKPRSTSIGQAQVLGGKKEWIKKKAVL